MLQHLPRWTIGGKEVALKLLNQNTEIELRGVRQCLNLKHPNLVSILDIKQDGEGDWWILMEYVSGKTLDAVVAARPTGMPVGEAQQWLNGICAGLSFLHDRGIVHRDLKPANIFSEDGHVKIGDVGLAKFISDSRRNAQTESVGTVYYMAPEISRGHYGHEVDVYSLAIVTFEMLTGHVLFDGESTAEILMKHLSQRPDLTALPENLRPVLARALEKDPLRRTPSVAAFQAEFNAAVGGRSVAVDIPEESFHRPESPPPLPRDTPMGRTTPFFLGPYHEKYARKAEKYRAKWARKAEKYRRKYGPRPITPQPVQQLASRERPRREWLANQVHFWIRVAAVSVVVLSIYRPQIAHKLLPALAIGGVVLTMTWGGSKLLGLLSAPVPPPRPYQPGWGQPASSPVFDAGPTMVAVPVGHGSPPPLPADRRMAAHARATPQQLYRAGALDPNTPRDIGLRQRMTELTGSMTFAVVATAIITAVLAMTTALLPDLGLAAVFGVTVLLGSWGVMGAAKLLEGSGAETGVRRMTFLVVGVALGAAAWWLQQTLLVELPRSGVSNAAFETVGSRDLLDPSAQPTLIGTLVFFGGLLGLRRWWWHADSFRSKRFRVSSVLMTGALAFLLTSLWAFPQSYAIVLAVTLSSVVQLASVWAAPSERVRFG